MLPGIGASELIVIAIVALVIVGPKDLPMLLRKFGQFMGRMRAMADDFRASFDEMARQSELDELRAQVEALRQARPLEDLRKDMAATSGEIEDGLVGEGRYGHQRGPVPVTPTMPGLDEAGLPPQARAVETADPYAWAEAKTPEPSEPLVPSEPDAPKAGETKA